MAPKKKPPKKLQGDGTSRAKMPAPKRITEAGKKSGLVAKKPSPKKAVRKPPTGIKKETKKVSTKASGKAGTTIEKEPEDVSDKPAGNTRAATKKGSKEPTKPAGKSVTATTTTKRSKGKSTKPVGNTGVVTKKPTPELVEVLSKGDDPAVSPTRKRKTEDKWTETTDLPVPKSPKLDEESSPSPSRKSREIRTLKDFASEEGWDTSGFHRRICCIDTVEPCRTPSPFANLADRKEKLMHIIENHAHPDVFFLFKSMQSGGNDARLQRGLDGQPPGAWVALKGKNTGPDFFVVRSDRPDFSRKLKGEDGKNSGISFDVHIRKNAKTGEIGYFAANKISFCMINEKLIGRRSAAGPLPGFAVIQIDNWILFWWRTRADLNYIPEAISQDAEEVEEGGATKDSSAPRPNSKEGEDTAKDPSIPPPSADKGGDTAKDPSIPPTSVIEGGDTAKDPSHPPTSVIEGGDTAKEPWSLLKNGSEGGEESVNEPLSTWEQIFNHRLELHHNQQDTAGDRHEYHRIDRASGMILDDVLYAIATIREPLRREGNDFAMAGSDVIDPSLQEVVAAGVLQGTGVIGEGNVFIMPLFFTPSAEELAKEHKRNLEKRGNANTDTTNSSFILGHFLLAVAERTYAESVKVKVEILDSEERYIHPDVIRRRAKEIVCAWLGTEVEPEFVFRDTPQQAYMSNACGLYVILNAWATMLDIGPVRKDRHRRGRCGNDTDFVKHGLEIVNLALAGFMDSRTIRAFLNRFGYTDVEEPIDREDIDVENAVVAVRMGPSRFDRTLHHLPLSSSSTTSAHVLGSDGQGTATKFPQHQLQEFLDNAPPGTTLDEAKKYLEATGGNVDGAVLKFFEDESQLDGPPGTEPS